MLYVLCFTFYRLRTSVSSQKLAVQITAPSRHKNAPVPIAVCTKRVTEFRSCAMPSRAGCTPMSVIAFPLKRVDWLESDRRASWYSRVMIISSPLKIIASPARNKITAMVI